MRAIAQIMVSEEITFVTMGGLRVHIDTQGLVTVETTTGKQYKLRNDGGDLRINGLVINFNPI
jgi:hypothetical protein